MTNRPLDTKKRYVFVYVITVTIVVALVLGILGLFWSELSAPDRAVASRFVPKLALYATAGFVACLFLFASMLQHLFREYIDPIVTLANETQLISVSESKFRISLPAAPEVIHLTDVINDLADEHLTLKTEVREIVERTRSEMQGEKQRLEALTAQMPDGVVVCNLDGRILLYNRQSQEILRAAGGGAQPWPAGAGILGIGRSIFGALDRRPFIHALNVLQGRTRLGHAPSPFTFVTSLRGDRFIRVRMSPVLSARGNEVEGYVLMVSDITERIRADSRRDMFLQSLTISLQQELGRIRDAAGELRALPAAGDPEAGDRVATIDRSSALLLERIDAVAMQHAQRLQNPGESEFILGEDLVDMLRETVVERFAISCTTRSDGDAWLDMNSYTVVRGVVYLLGQLTTHLQVTRVELSLETGGDRPLLSVRWQGDPVLVRTIEQWKECPLMLGGSGRGPVSLTTLLAGRGDVSSVSGDDGTEETVCVRFLLDSAGEESPAATGDPRGERPVYYDFALFDALPPSPDLDATPLSQLSFVVFDSETTGLDPSGGDEIISLGAIRIVRGKLRREEVFDQLVDPRRSIPLESLRIHQISPDMLRGMPVVTDVLREFRRFAEGAVLVAHNAAFDMTFLRKKQDAAGVAFDLPVLDTLLLSAIAWPTEEPHNLDALAQRFGLPIVGRHTALGDAILTAEVFLRLLPLLEAQGIRTLADAREASRHTPYSSLRF